MSKKKQSHKAAEGAGFAALVAAAAGAYFLYGSKEGAKRRKKIKSWTVKAKAEVLEKLEKAGELNEKAYHQIVDEVAEKYKKYRHVDAEEVEKMVKDLKGHWMKMKKQAEAEMRKHERKNKSAARKPATKKAPAKKKTTSTAKKKPAAKKTPAKKTAAKKPAAKKTTTAKKPAAKKSTTTRKPATKKK